MLDYLAGELIRGGWKLKPLHKLMMTSAAYAQGGAAHADGLKLDPDNKLWWRVPPRRLEAEAVRDALLAVGGTLDATMHGPATADQNSGRRSVYLTVKRSRPIPLLATFDAPEAIQSVGERPATTVATQSLAMMNSPFVRQKAEKLAARVRPMADADLPAAVASAYRIALGRTPADAERDRLVRFVRGADPAARDAALVDACQVLLCANEFLYVD